jgi:alpha-glucosidase (family GH31 glycosyl hydrolase)
VAPVLTSGATSRSVYLPALPNGGKWLDYNNPSATYTGGTTITAAAGVDVIPTYLRAGAIVPRGDVVQANNRWDPNYVPTIRVEVAPGTGVFDYYTAAGVNTMKIAPLGTGWEFTCNPLAMTGSVRMFLPAAPATVKLNGSSLLREDDYTYAGGMLDVPVGPGDAAVTLDVIP